MALPLVSDRRMLITLEIDTNLPRAELENYGAWDRAFQGTFFGGPTFVRKIRVREWRRTKLARKPLRVRKRARVPIPRRRPRLRLVTNLGKRVRSR